MPKRERERESNAERSVTDPDTGDLDEINNTLNGAQTQALLTIIDQFQSGKITEDQAVAIIMVSDGLTQAQAEEILTGK